MLTVFGRAEVALTRDPARFGAVKAALESSGIEYSVKMRDPDSPHPYDQAQVGSLGIRPAWEYRIYVNKKDLERAQAVLARI